MQIECAQCHKPLKLPDAKLPRGRAFNFTCPYCKTKNTAMIPAEEEAAATVLPQEFADTAPHHKPEPPAPPAPLRPGDTGDIKLPYPEAGLEDDALNEEADGRPKALVFYDDPEVTGRLVKKMDEIGYRAVVALNMRDAARHIRLTKFSIMLIQEDYMGASITGNHLLRSVQIMDNRSRRGALVALISPTLSTLDDLTAFALSVDAIINSADIEQIGQLLLSSIAQAKKLYSVYEEMLAEQGIE